MTHRFLILALTALFSSPFSVRAENVLIPDPKLRAAVLVELGKSDGGDITVADLTGLKRIAINLERIDWATDLESSTDLQSWQKEGSLVKDSKSTSLPRTGNQRQYRLRNIDTTVNPPSQLNNAGGG
ncbi:MAG: hypothetical protein R3F19_00425 [Verrucomicrobiales bacterium]